MPGRKQPCSVSLPLHSITLNWCPTTLALTSISQTSASPCLLPLPPTFSPFWHKHSEVSLWDCHKLALSSSPTTFYQTLALGGFKGTLLNNVRFITLLCYISLWARWWTIWEMKTYRGLNTNDRDRVVRQLTMCHQVTSKDLKSEVTWLLLIYSAKIKSRVTYGT